MELNQIIRKLRKEKGLTQEQLAELLGVSLMSIRRWEWGETSPNSKMLLKLANVLGLSPEALLTEDIVESIPVQNRERNKKELPNMAYWGGVADNARNVAEYGSNEDMAGVIQMLRRALAYFGAMNRETGQVATA